MIDIAQKGIRRREVWFDEPWETKGADLMVFYCASQALGAGQVRDVYSLEIDLQQQEDDIWKGFKSNTRNEINRSKKDGIVFEAWTNPSPEIFQQFLNFYREWATERGRYGVGATWFSEYARHNVICLTRASSPDHTPLVWHSYLKVEDRVRLLHSVSRVNTVDPEFRKVIGRANRFLHWMDILEWRNRGVRQYDFGGWYHGNEDEKLLRINAFKEGFGGTQTHRYHSMRAVSLMGTLFLKTRALVKGNRELVHYI